MSLQYNAAHKWQLKLCLLNFRRKTDGKRCGSTVQRAGKIYYFDPDVFDIKVGDKVIVETAREWNSATSS